MKCQKCNRIAQGWALFKDGNWYPSCGLENWHGLKFTPVWPRRCEYCRECIPEGRNRKAIYCSVRHANKAQGLKRERAARSKV